MRKAPQLVDRLIAWAPVLLLALLAALTFWLDSQIQQQTRRDGTTRHDPDIFIHSFRAVSYDADGHLRQALAATYGQHYPDDDSIDLVAPLVELTDPGKPRVSVTADKGNVSGDRETIVLTGHVRASRDADTAQHPAQPAPKNNANKAPPIVDSERPAGPVTITTDYLRIIPKQERADTNKAVTIEEPRGIIHATGMELDNKAKTLKLKSGVHGSLEPAKK